MSSCPRGMFAKDGCKQDPGSGQDARRVRQVRAPRGRDLRVRYAIAKAQPTETHEGGKCPECGAPVRIYLRRRQQVDGMACSSLRRAERQPRDSPSDRAGDWDRRGARRVAALGRPGVSPASRRLVSDCLDTTTTTLRLRPRCGNYTWWQDRVGYLRLLSRKAVEERDDRVSLARQ